MAQLHKYRPTSGVCPIHEVRLVEPKQGFASFECQPPPVFSIACTSVCLPFARRSGEVCFGPASVRIRFDEPKSLEWKVKKV
jgi:hypothetical protein